MRSPLAASRSAWLLAVGGVGLAAWGCAPGEPARIASGRPPSSRPAPETETETEFFAHVVRVGDFGFGLVPENDPGTRYAPDRLPLDLQVEGLRLRVRGRIGSPDDAPRGGDRRWGTPLVVTSVDRAPVPTASAAKEEPPRP